MNRRAIPIGVEAYKDFVNRFDIDTFTKQVNAQLVETISYYDYSESYLYWN